MDEMFMKEALIEAGKAFDMGEVPIGAVIVCDGKIVGRGHNTKERDNDPTAHAEIIAIKDATTNMSAWRLTDCTAYVTIEPCAMCMGALVNARVSRLVFGSPDPKGGAAVSLYTIGDDDRLNHSFKTEHGVLQYECQQIMKDFFKKLR